MKIRISPGNTKMGPIPSISLPAIKTCRACACHDKCYAHKLEKLRPSVRKAYESNLNLYTRDPDTYWREAEAAIMMNRYFRFHVSGDIPDYDYLLHMISIASRVPTCEILCFTKRYEFVNRALEALTLPANLHIIFSGWKGLPMDNPFHLPEAHVRYRDGTTTACETAVLCNGNCSECAITNNGCWTLKHGEQIVFNEH